MVAVGADNDFFPRKKTPNTEGRGQEKFPLMQRIKLTKTEHFRQGVAAGTYLYVMYSTLLREKYSSFHERKSALSIEVS